MPQFVISIATFCDKHGPRIIQCTQSRPDVLPEYSHDSYCESCILHFPAGTPPTTTTIRTANYTSTQYSGPNFNLMTSVVKKIFSEESTTYGDHQPMYFGDKVRGYNLLMGFKIADPLARGSERRYCMVVTCDEESSLLPHWELVLTFFHKSIDYLVAARARVLAKQDNHVGYLRGNRMKEPCGLSTLLEDDQLFVKLHRWNVLLLETLYA